MIHLAEDTVVVVSAVSDYGKEVSLERIELHLVCLLDLDQTEVFVIPDDVGRLSIIKESGVGED